MNTPPADTAPVIWALVMVLSAVLGSGATSVINAIKAHREGETHEVDLNVRIREATAFALKDLQDRLDYQVEDLKRLRAELRTAENYVTETRRHLRAYEGRVAQLEAILRVAGIEVPPWTMLPGDNVDTLGE